MYGAYLFINGHQLLNINSEGVYELLDTGNAFLNNEITTLQVLDEAEGILKLLSILSTKKKAKRGDLLTAYISRRVNLKSG